MSGIDPGWMYILRCSDDQLYVGSTIDLQKRIQMHNTGLGSNFTKVRYPVELVHCEYFSTVAKAFRREKQIQKWTRQKKEALIASDFNKLKEFAQCLNQTSHKNLNR